jgi:hypothetical protein
MLEVRPIDANALFNDLKASAKAAREWKEETQDEEIKIRAEQTFGTFVECALRVKNAPTIEPEVRRGNGCSYCKGRAYSKKPLTVITRTMKRVEVVFEYCPSCGKKMNGGEENATD